MSLKPHKPIRQEYIAKVRYINNLPPPPLNPKFIDYNTTEKVSSKTESEQLMSSLFRKENFTSFIESVDEELGMNLNLINNSGFLDNENESSIYKMVGEKNDNDDIKHVVLHPKDRALLRDAGIGNISKSEPDVSFLRRTEYIAERQLPKSNGNLKGNDDVAEIAEAKKAENANDPAAQLAAVENTFDQAQETLDSFSNLKHPGKKHLKAVSTWPLLPDTSMMDSKFLTLKFSGSASISRELQLLKRQQKDKYDETFQKNSLESAIFRPITSEDGEWISMYQVRDAKKAEEIKEKLNSSERERPVNILDEQEDIEDYKFKHSKDYDMNFHRFSKPYEELAIKFEPAEDSSETKKTRKRKAAYYYPVTGRIELKKHRASTNSEINRFLRDSAVDVINFTLREPNTNEIRKMDAIRSEFDPMDYEGEEDIAEEFDDATGIVSGQAESVEKPEANNVNEQED